MNVTFTLNGETQVFDVAGPEILLSVLRNDLNLPGTKDAC
jgi:aerobic-type carbon monoxide dehydrogenase small subunit (CoxS/CutS family)